MPPSEFWRLHPQELWWLIDAWRDDGARKAGKLTDDDRTELRQALAQAQDLHAQGKWLQ